MEAVIAGRLKQMCKAARRGRKAVPSAELLDGLVAAVIADDMRCPTCRRTMNWLYADGTSTQVTLQHDRDGTLRLLCKGCNTRHSHLPGDLFYQIALDCKRCPRCELIKPNKEFYQTKKGRPASLCVRCAREVAMSKYMANHEANKLRQRDRARIRRERATP